MSEDAADEANEFDCPACSVSLTGYPEACPECDIPFNW